VKEEPVRTTSISAESSIRFGAFELALKSGELRKDGAPVKLQPQPFKVLALLAAHAGQLVTREELQQQIWADETFVDFEHGLNFCIKQIRGALGDNAQAPRFIETLPRRGYRFIARTEKSDVSAIDPPAGVSEGSNDAVQSGFARGGATDGEGGLAGTRGSIVAKAEPRGLADSAEPFETYASKTRSGSPLNSKSKIQNSKAFIAAAVLVLGVVLAGYAAWQRFAARPQAPSGKVMLAVLPFENLSADPEQDYFSDGLTEEMIAQLGSLQPQRLGVIARTSAMTYKSANKDIRQIGRELGVDYILEGSVRRDGERLRITAQLIQVADQTHLWSESYNRSQSDALGIQGEVAGRVARSLALALLPARVPENSASSAVQPAAHEAYLRGRYLWNKGRVADLEKSVEYFNQAIELDRQYAAAYAGLADSYRLLAMFQGLSVQEALPKSIAAAETAIALDDRLAEAHAALGSVRFWFERNWDAAEREFRLAIEINPSYGPAHHDYAWYLVVMGRADEGVSEIKRARDLDPLSPLANSDVGWIYLSARKYDDAIAEMQRTLELEPNSLAVQDCLEHAYLYQGMYAEAAAAARRQMARLGASPEELAAIDRLDVNERLNAVYRWRLSQKLTAAQTRRVSAFSVAGLYAALRDQQRALEWLEKAFAERDLMLASLSVNPGFDGLRGDPRFGELLRRIGFPQGSHRTIKGGQHVTAMLPIF